MDELSLTRFKPCTKCGIIYPATLTHFLKHPRGRYGLQAKCRVCHQAATRAWYNAHPEKRKSGWQAWKSKYPQRRKETNERWKQENPVKYRESQQKAGAKWYASNRDKKLVAKKRWRKATPEKQREYWRAKWASLKGAEGSHTFEEVWQMHEDQGGLCAYCETPLFGTYHVDHMHPLSRGGRNDWVNLAITCAHCNLSKHNKTAEEFFNHL